MFTIGEKFLRQWGKTGKGDGAFEAPGGIAIAKNGEVYVTDQINHRVQVFTSDGKFLRKWGQHGSQPGQFGGKVPASSRWGGPPFPGFRQCRQRLHDGRSGLSRAEVHPRRQVSAHLGRRSGPTRQLRQEAGARQSRHQRGPIGICVDPQDQVWVAAVGGLVQQFSKDGKFCRTIGQRQASGPGQFQAPHGLAMDSQANLYVVDTYNHRIQKFATTTGR